MAIQALVMGFGGTGAHILTFLKELTVLKYGNRLDSVRFLLFDTIADWRPGSTVRILGGAAEEKLAVGREEGTSLDPNTEYFYLADHDPDLSKHVFELLGDAGDPQSYPHLKDWLHTSWLSLHVPKHQLTIKEGAAQQRQIGRFAMFQNAGRIVSKIELEIRRLRDRARGGVINVWVIGSAAGGTGGGCLLDAAFFARAAAKDVAVNLTGVIVLPEVYDDKEGISPGRAYSLFRELDRFQEQGCLATDRFVDTNKMISSRVGYDARRQLESSVPSRLFDYLFYAGQTCRNDGARMSFFTSVANAIDPFLDEESGPTLLQSSVNSFAAASSFGAARLYIPVETYGDLFAWEEVAKYIEAAAAPRRADIVVDLYHGSVDDRQRNGRGRVESLLPLFKTVLELAGKTEKELEQFARLLSPASIVKEWYGFGGAAVAGLALTPAEQQVALLTYINPYISWTEDDPGRVPAKDRNLKTYEENREAKGARESREESRDRFAKELGIITTSYQGRDAGDRTFEKGRRLVFDKLSRLLAARVDELVLNELTQKPQFARDADAPEQGTVMTRLFQELKEILGDDGFLARIDGTVSGFIAAMQGEESFRQGEAVRAVKDLTEWSTSGIFGLGPSVEGPQGSAREASGDYLTAFQKFRLLQDMQRLVREVKARFEAWAGLVRRGFEGLALDVAASSYTETAKQLRRLDGRLGRLADNPTALISCAERDPRNPDVTMQGFADRLRQACVMPDGRFSLADAALAASSWQVSVDGKTRPQLELVVRLGEQERRFTTDSIAQLHRELHDHFRGLIDPRLEQFGIFDYLLYAQESPRNVQPEQIAQRLNAAAEVLINAAQAPETCTLIYTDPVAPGKRNLASAIQREVGRGFDKGEVAESHHSDRFALTLLKVRKPNLDAIQNIADCRDDYLLWQGAGRNGHQEHDEELFRAQVYHPFRPELEAWYIERRQSALDQRGISARDHLPPRIVRLLEDPAMMQAFVHCVATGAVEKSDGSWLWHGAVSDSNVFLTEREAEPRADLLRAAVVFVLQQREGRRQGLIPIRLDDARKSAVKAAQEKGLSRDEALSQFLKQQLDGYLRDHFPIGDDGAAYERELRGLHVLFEFYCHPQTQTQLRERLDLGHRV